MIIVYNTGVIVSGFLKYVRLQQLTAARGLYWYIIRNVGFDLNAQHDFFLSYNNDGCKNDENKQWTETRANTIGRTDE